MEFVFIGLAVIVTLAFMLGMRGSAIQRETRRAVRTGEVDKLVAMVSEKEGDSRATAIDNVTKSMWDAYERSVAATFIKAVARKTSRTSIVQYWLRQVLEVEPDIAREQFDPEFLADCFHPELAMRCGKSG